jgi:hypothetical protein
VAPGILHGGIIDFAGPVCALYNGFFRAAGRLIVHVGAYMAVLAWWLDGGAKLSPRRMDEFFQRLMSEGIKSLSS